MKHANDHRWGALPPEGSDLLGHFAALCGLERKEDKIHELWVCGNCGWTKIRHTYGVDFISDKVAQNNEPACEPKPHSPEHQAAVDAFEARHSCECGEVNVPTAKVCSGCGKARS